MSSKLTQDKKKKEEKIGAFAFTLFAHSKQEQKNLQRPRISLDPQSLIWVYPAIVVL